MDKVFFLRYCAHVEFMTFKNGTIENELYDIEINQNFKTKPNFFFFHSLSHIDATAIKFRIGESKRGCEIIAHREINLGRCLHFI